MHDVFFQLTIGGHELDVTGWQAALAGGVIVGMPWLVGVVSIVRIALYGW